MLIVSLLVLPTKAIAEPPEIVPTSINIKTYAFDVIFDIWGSSQWDSFDKLIERESHWKSEAQNPKSTAYGIGQFLNSTWKDVGCVKTSDKYKQIDCTIKYIQDRYGTPHKALSFHYKNNYY